MAIKKRASKARTAAASKTSKGTRKTGKHKRAAAKR